uniref:Peptidase S1 domain-containing protein n=1 Tax=Oncorhynchus tshawytscha TaxID=74940 RepID=A0A8C8C085_ONCTS
MCHNKVCVSKSSVCDGVIDCKDRSDEINCTKACESVCQLVHPSFYQSASFFVYIHPILNPSFFLCFSLPPSLSVCPVHKGCSPSSYKCANGKCVNKINPECDGCGTRPRKRAKIVGGSDAGTGAWPWQVSLQMERYGHVCGATLVTSRWLISAAHCFQDSDTINNAAATRQIRRIILHSQYDQFTSDYDIALLELSTPVYFNDLVQPVCVPASSHAFTTGTSCHVTGWGVLMEDGKSCPGITFYLCVCFPVGFPVYVSVCV